MQQLDELRRTDRRLEIFGASSHRYASTKLTSHEVNAAEEAMGCKLPSEYRNLLLTLGHGAGPYYGLWSPARGLSELRGLALDYEGEKSTQVSCATPFPLSLNDIQSIEARLLANHRTPWAEHDWPCSGCLPICHHGCEAWSVIVTTGELAGKVIDFGCTVGYLGLWGPACRAPGLLSFPLMVSRPELPHLPAPPTFGEWFQGWIERCLADFAAIRTQQIL